MAAPAFIAKNSGYALTGAQPQLTLALNVGSAADRWVGIMVGSYTTLYGTDPLSCTYAGVSLSSSTAHVDVEGYEWRLYSGITTATGSNNFVVSFTNDLSTVVGLAIAYSGVDQSTPMSGEAFTNVADAAPTITVSSATGDLAIAFGYTRDTSLTYTVTSPSVERADDDIGGTRGWIIERAGGASVALAGALNTSSAWLQIGVSLKSASSTPVASAAHFFSHLAR